jgi:hypothetical protein
MKKLLVVIAGLITISSHATAQDASPRVKPGVNLLGDKNVDPRTKEYRQAIDREYDAALKKIPEQKTTKKDPWANIRSAEPTKK